MSTTTSRSHDRAPADLRLGRVRLRVADLDRMLGFYRDLLRLHASDEDDVVALAARPGGPPLFLLEPDPAAPPRPQVSTGLYHTAILFPSRGELGAALGALLARGVPFDGFSDHAVSEAAYLADPEGNGLELYVDRPRSEWSIREGEIFMTTRPLDLAGLLEAAGGAGGEDWAGPPPDTRVGHIHLQVSDLETAGRFYERGLGLDVVTRRYPGALFLSAGGYHHHVGLNAWAGPAAAPPPARSRGLVDFEIELPAAVDVERTAGRLRGLGFATEPGPAGFDVEGPDRTRVRIVARS